MLDLMLPNYSSLQEGYLTVAREGRYKTLYTKEDYKSCDKYV